MKPSGRESLLATQWTLKNSIHVFHRRNSIKDFESMAGDVNSRGKDEQIHGANRTGTVETFPITESILRDLTLLDSVCAILHKKMQYTRFFIVRFSLGDCI